MNFNQLDMYICKNYKTYMYLLSTELFEYDVTYKKQNCDQLTIVLWFNMLTVAVVIGDSCY